MLARPGATSPTGSVRRPRVALDAHTVGRRQTGNERYVVELGNALAARTDVEVLAYLDANQGWPSPVDGPGPITRHLRFRQPQLRIPIELPVRVRRDRADLLHVSYVAPPLPGVPVVTVVHDVSFEDMPSALPLPTRLRLQLMVRLAVRRSAAVLTGSEFTRRRLIDLYGPDPERVHAVPYGVAPQWHPLGRDEQEVRLRLRRLPTRFVLSVGAASPRKNLSRLIEAIAMLRGAGFAGMDLVVAGPAVAAGGQSEIGRTIARHHAERWVHFLGYVSDGELQALYCRADVVAYPSLYEGFGLPVLEALACGAVVVCSSTTALPEVAGESAIMVDPADPRSIARGLEAALSDEALRSRLRELGPSQAARFSWSKCAAGTVGVYLEVLRLEPPR